MTREQRALQFVATFLNLFPELGADEPLNGSDVVELLSSILYPLALDVMSLAPDAMQPREISTVPSV